MKLLAPKIKRALKIWFFQIRISLMQRMAYRFNFFLMIISVFVQMFLSLVFIKVIFSFAENISGWTFENALLVVASYMFLEGLMWATCAYFYGISVGVREGTIDMVLTKPIDPQFILTIWRCDPEDWARVITALLIFVYVVSGLGLGFGTLVFNLFVYGILLFNAYLILYSLIISIKSTSFWVIENRALHGITETLTRSTQYPIDIFFHKTVRLFFSTVIPLAFLTTVPAKALIYGPNWYLVFISTFLAIIFFISARAFFFFALKHYDSASS